MSYIQTVSGERFYPADIYRTTYKIADIAHNLSNLCRFAGATHSFYSVAQHCVHVSEILEGWGESKLVQLQGLLHDSMEAYLIDMPAPIKHMPFMDGYRQLEDQLELWLARQFGFDNFSSGAVKRADIACLAAESRDLMNDPQDWPILSGVVVPAFKVNPWLPGQARDTYLERFALLTAAVAVEAQV